MYIQNEHRLIVTYQNLIIQFLSRFADSKEGIASRRACRTSSSTRVLLTGYKGELPASVYRYDRTRPAHTWTSFN